MSFLLMLGTPPVFVVLKHVPSHGRGVVEQFICGVVNQGPGDGSDALFIHGLEQDLPRVHLPVTG